MVRTQRSHVPCIVALANLAGPLMVRRLAGHAIVAPNAFAIMEARDVSWAPIAGTLTLTPIQKMPTHALSTCIDLPVPLSV